MLENSLLNSKDANLLLQRLLSDTPVLLQLLCQCAVFLLELKEEGCMLEQGDVGKRSGERM